MAPAMPCKTCKKSKHGETRSKTNDFKSKFPCILEASGSTRRTSTEISWGPYRRKRGQSTAALQYGTQIYSYASSMEDTRRKSSSGKNGTDLKRFRRGTKQKSETNLTWLMKQEKKVEKYTSHHWWTYVIWKMPNWTQSTKNTKVELVSEETSWKMILDLVQYSLNKEHQHHRWRQQRSWMSYPDCQGAQDKQLMQYLLKLRSKWKILQNYWKIQNRNVQTYGFVKHDTNGQNHGPVWKTQSFFLKGNLYGHPLAGLLWGQAIWEKSFENTVGRKFPIGNACSYTVKKDYSHQCMWMTSNLLERNKILIRCGKCQTKKRTNIIPWSCIPGVHSKTMWKKQRYFRQLQNHVWLQNFRRSNLKITMLGKSDYLFVVLWHGRSCQEMCGTILWVGKQDDWTTLQSIYSMHRLP